jgi:hypothetical protein
MIITHTCVCHAIPESVINLEINEPITIVNRSRRLGTQALFSNTTGGSNYAFGYYALGSNTTGSNNSALGREALRSNTTASGNTAVGYQAAYSTTTAINSTAIGYQALYAQTTANGLGWNSAFGLGCLSGVTTGFYNVGVGGNAGNTLTTGSACIFIGTFAAASAVGVSNEAVIGGGLTGKGGNTIYVMGSSGAYNQANTTTWSTTSDRRLKKNIVDNTVGLEKIAAIQVRNFEYRLPEEVDAELKPTDAIEKSGVQLGVIAQELQQVLKTEKQSFFKVRTQLLKWQWLLIQ